MCWQIATWVKNRRPKRSVHVSIIWSPINPLDLADGSIGEGRAGLHSTQRYSVPRQTVAAWEVRTQVPHAQSLYGLCFQFRPNRRIRQPSQTCVLPPALLLRSSFFVTVTERSQHQHNTTTTSPANTLVVSKIQYSIKTPRLRHRQPAARCCLSPSERRQEACLAAAPAPTRQRSTHCALPRCRISSSSITASPSTQSNLVVRLICHHERSSQRRA